MSTPSNDWYGGISSGLLVTPTLLVVNHGGRDMADEADVPHAISAYDKDSGEHIGSVRLPAVPGGNPITYLHEGKQHLVVAIGSGSSGDAPELIALTLP